MIETKSYGSITEQELRHIIYSHWRDYGSYNPSVYCTTKKKYDEDPCNGMWLDITTFDDYEEFVEFLGLLHNDEENAEIMFSDFDYFPEKWYTEEMMTEKTFDKIKEYASGDMDAYDAYINYYYADSLDGFEERYVGKFESEEHFAKQHFMDADMDFPQNLMRYFDWKVYAYDLFEDWGHGYDFIDGYVFRTLS